MNVIDKFEQEGWTSEMKDIHVSFIRHQYLLLTIARLEVIPFGLANILQRDFEQNTWAKIRDGE
jgi:hypothetical protein